MKLASAPYGRLTFILIPCVLYTFLILAGLFNIQVLQAEKFSVQAEQQHWLARSVAADRGTIYSSDGYPLATNELAYLLYAEPPFIEDPEDVSEDLIEILGVNRVLDQIEESILEEIVDDEDQERKFSEEYIQERLSLELQWVSLFHKVSEEERLQILALGYEGLGFDEEPKRSYPEGELAAHVLGFMGSDYRGGDQGYFGVEGYYDGDLRGDEGSVSEERTALGEPILVGQYKRINPVDGRALTLTIDRTVQHIVERHLQSGVEAYDAQSGSVVVLDPHTGAILAMASTPAFDPNDPFAEDETKSRAGEDQQEDPDSEKDSEEKSHAEIRSEISRRNRAIASTYEPGSVIKPLTVAAALDLGLVTPQTTVEDNGIITASGFPVNNWDGQHHGTISMTDILVLSNNVGSAQVGQMVGASSLSTYFSEFGLGTLTGVDLEGEDTGVLQDPATWRDIDVMTKAFGQGFSATPLQLANAFSVFANGGVLMRPYIVSSVQEGDTITTFSPEKVTRVLEEETALLMQDMLTRAADAGEARYYNIRNYEIAGKTGTAQIAEDGKYLANKTNTTFIGFLPNNPRFVLLVTMEKPTASTYAAETAVPVWMDITRDLVVHFGIEPDKFSQE